MGLSYNGTLKKKTKNEAWKDSHSSLGFTKKNSGCGDVAYDATHIEEGRYK
jgi:hypothetical protein